MRSPPNPMPGQCRFCGCTYWEPCADGCAWWDRAQTICTRCIERAIDLAALLVWDQAHPDRTAETADALREIAR